MKSLACLGDELVLEPVSSKDPWRFLFTYLLGFIWGFPSGSAGKEPACQCRRCGFDLWEDPLEEEMAPHSSILAWKIPWTEESGGLESDTTACTHESCLQCTGLVALWHVGS